MNIAQFVFFDQSSTSQTSNAFGNINQGSALTLQVDSVDSSTPTLGLTLEGAVDLNMPDNYFPLKVISMETFRPTTKITKTGIYMVVIDGVGKIRIKSDSVSSLGTFKAYAISVS